MNGTHGFYNASTRTHFENLNSEVVKDQNVLNMHKNKYSFAAYNIINTWSIPQFCIFAIMINKYF